MKQHTCLLILSLALSISLQAASKQPPAKYTSLSSLSTALTPQEDPFINIETCIRTFRPVCSTREQYLDSFWYARQRAGTDSYLLMYGYLVSKDPAALKRAAIAVHQELPTYEIECSEGAHIALEEILSNKNVSYYRITHNVSYAGSLLRCDMRESDKRFAFCCPQDIASLIEAAKPAVKACSSDERPQALSKKLSLLGGSYASIIVMLDTHELQKILNAHRSIGEIEAIRFGQ